MHPKVVSIFADSMEVIGFGSMFMGWRYVVPLVLPMAWMVPACLGTGETADAPAAARELTLDDAIDFALENNRGILTANLDVEDAEVTVLERNADFDIRIQPEAAAGITADNETASYGLQARRRFEIGGSAGVAAGYRYDENDAAYVRVDMDQPLFRDAGRLVTLEPLVQSRFNLLDARRSLHLRKEDLVVDVVSGYEAVLQARRQLQNERETVERLERLMELTRAGEDAGSSTRIDTLRVELQLGESRSRLANALELLALEEEDFCNLIGATNDCSFIFRPPPLIEVAYPDFDSSIDVALSNRMDFARAVQAVRDAERGVKIARKGLQPDLTVRGRYEWAGGQDGADAFDLEENNWFAGISLDPDLNRYQRRADYRRSLNRLNREDIQRTDLEYAISRDVKQNIRAYRRARTDYDIAVKNTDLAWKRLELAEAMFRMGKGDNFTVTDAEQAYTAARTAEFAARADASVASYRLLRSMGTLIEVPDDLRP